MWTDSVQLKRYSLTTGRNELTMPADAKVKETTPGSLITVEPRKVAMTRRVFWVFGCNEHVSEDLFARLTYVGAWSNGTRLASVWEEKLAASQGKAC